MNSAISAFSRSRTWLSARTSSGPAGGAATVAGVSSTATVSVVGISPLSPGVNYQAWVVGVNSRGEGPASNKLSFTA